MSSPQAVPDALIGQIISGQYRIDQVLGQGGMGTVYRGTQLSVGRGVAIKVINADALSNEQLRTRFAREAQALSRLTHPNTVRLFDYGMTEQQQPFMVMELLQGIDVATEIEKNGALGLKRALRITLQVLRALQEAHAQGVTHRDLKPSNIFLTQVEGSEVFAKVLDFGIAGFDQVSEAKKLTVTGIVMGSAAYMSPEQAQGQGVGPASDLYSVGAVLFEMLTGLPPFQAETMVSMLVAHITQPTPRLDLARPEMSAPRVVQQLIDDLMAKTVDSRPSSAKTVADRIEALLSSDLFQSGDGLMARSVQPVQAAQPVQPAQSAQRAAPSADRAFTPSSGSGVSDAGSPAVSAPSRPNTRGSHAPLYAGLGLIGVATLGIGGWFMFRSQPANGPAPEPLAAITAPLDSLAQAPGAVSISPTPANAASSAGPVSELPAAARSATLANPPENLHAELSHAPNPSAKGAASSPPAAKASAGVAVKPVPAATTAAPLVRTPPLASMAAPVASAAKPVDPALTSLDRATRRTALLKAPRYTSVAAAKSALAKGAITREGYDDAIWVLKNLREVSLRAAKADYKSHKIDKETYRARVDEIEGRYRGL